jgi:Ca-activated chloride channel family protein
MFRFESPLLLLLLLALPLAIYLRRRRYYPVMGSSSLVGLARLRPSWGLWISRMLPVLKYLALALMVLALARPQWGTRQMNVLTEGINIVLAVDLSESMAALDFKQGKKIVNRLEAVREVISEFVSHRSQDRIGMVVFGSHAYTQLPLTRDYNTIVTMLERLKIGAAGRSTALGDAIGISLKRLADIEAESNIIILLTDGRSNSGELQPQEACDIAVAKGVKIYTIGVGTRGKAPFLVNDPIFGQRYVYQQVDIDEDTLQKIADKTEGLYFRAEDLPGLKRIYATIDQMEKTEVEVTTFAEYDELYIYLLLPALAVLGSWIVLTNTRFLRIP